MKLRVAPPKSPRVDGSLRPPSDKSMTQRALIFSMLAEGTSKIVHPLEAGSTRSVRNAIERLGAVVTEHDDLLEVAGALRLEPDDAMPIDLEGSGTGARLLLGALAGRGVSIEITGDSSLRRRPMGRVVRPLTRMGAHFSGDDLDHLPLKVRAALPLRPYDGELEVASSQAKGAVLLAALGAEGTTRLRERQPTRTHTEAMLAEFGAPVTTKPSGVGVGVDVFLSGPQKLRATTIHVPGDPSAAAFHAAAAAAVPGARIELRDLLVDSHRAAFFDVLQRMGAHVERKDAVRRGGELVGTLVVEGRELHAVEIGADDVPDLIDELPLVAVLGAVAKGTTRVHGAGELRVKESDRVHALGDGLARLGARVWLEPDGFLVEGGRPLRGADVSSCGDHRIAMALVVAALSARGESTVDGFECAEVSYPGFLEDLAGLLHARPFAAVS
jgi:3-phosphoshikimate 1-carboxyvinyltransferase